MAKLVNVGFGNLINSDMILAIVSPDSAPAKREIQLAKEQKLIIDATQGRKTKSIIYTTGPRIVLSALQPDTIAGRMIEN